MLRLILIFGLISLLGDFVYEGARSVYGSFFRHLGVDPFTLAVLIGLGDFLAYGLRLISGYISDRIRGYWTFTILGYLLVVSIPLMGFVDSWILVSALVLMERIGKGLRTPARDTIISFVTRGYRGLGFGIHESLDQIGAILGPIAFSLMLMYGYGFAFRSTLLPFLMMMTVLIYLRLKLPNPERLEHESHHDPRLFKRYVLFVIMCGLGLVNYPILAYHYSRFMRDEIVPLLYAFAMVVDAAFAPIVGRLYDLKKMKVLPVIPIVTALSSISFLNPIGLAFLGIAMAIHETIMKAVVADYVGVSKRSTAYGVFNAFYGLSLFVGSSTIGFLYPNLSNILLYVFFVEAFCVVYAFSLKDSAK